MKTVNLKNFADAATLLAKGHELDRSGRSDEAEELYRTSIDSLENSLSGTDSADTLNVLAHYAFHHGTALEDLGKLGHAAAAYGRAIEIWDALREDGCSADLIMNLARALSAMARIKRKNKRFKEAHTAYTRARALLLNLISLTPASDPKREMLLKVLSGTVLGGFKCAVAAGRRQSARTMRRDLKRMLGQ